LAARKHAPLRWLWTAKQAIPGGASVKPVPADQNKNIALTLQTLKNQLATEQKPFSNTLIDIFSFNI
jgi:hypothetical protein